VGKSLKWAILFLLAIDGTDTVWRLVHWGYYFEDAPWWIIVLFFTETAAFNGVLVWVFLLLNRTSRNPK
jgi:hypothetical protein